MATDRNDARWIPVVPIPTTAFARFVLCGGGVGVASSAAVSLCAALMPWMVANALMTATSTVLCTELHARFTFGAGQRAGWRRHWQSAGSAAAAYAVTCAAMAVLHTVRPSPGIFSEQAVYLSAAGLAGTGRFLVLRLFVFADSAHAGTRIAAPDQGRRAGRAAPGIRLFLTEATAKTHATGPCAGRDLRLRAAAAHARDLSPAHAHAAGPRTQAGLVSPTG
ncbi:GtrA family protein [Streptomyces sp. NPDC059340]|uniref:GtrA family protein n=1 Tax=Streptomyces sp. NPDC059340 TaxID=3346806 RepID=UPI0036A69A88